MTSTATIKAFPLPPAFTAADLYSIDEHSEDSTDAMSNEHVQRMGRTTRAASQSSAHPVYPGTQNASRFQDRSLENFHTTLKRPKKLAGTSANGNGSGSGSNYTPTSPLAQEGIEGPRRRAASVGNRMTLNTLETSSWVRESVYQSSPIRAAFRPDRRPNEVFNILPGEVLDLVLLSLKGLHLDKNSDSCATCWMRDICSAALCSRRWYKHARVALYDDIQIVGSDSAAHKKKFKQNQGNRMAMLRRTLRANPDIAVLVKSLKVPHPEPPLNWSASKGMQWLEQYEDRVATLIMACPKLERLSGPTPNYDHSFKKIFHALSTRTALKDMTWIMEPALASASQGQRTDSPSKQRGQSGPSMLEPSQGIALLDSHRNWSSLTKLSILCQPGATLAPHRLLSKTLTYLPSLQHLHLCNLPPNAFNDNNLLSLPPLKSLILSRIVGITSNGLTSFATRSNTSHLERLELRHTPLTSLPALARIFSYLPALKHFCLAQSFPPVMPETDSFALWMMPYLASSTITKLHWDITSHPGSVNAADDILARSIEAGGFPALTTLRAPNDPEGRFQALCRPVAYICLPNDRFFRHNAIGSIPTSGSFSAPSSPISPIHKSATTMSLPSTIYAAPSLGTDLQKARLAAQSRLEAAHEVPRFKFAVITDEGQVAQTFAGFIGTLGSKITYHLLPDDGATDEQGGLVDVIDLVGDAGEALSGSREGCTGRWNQKEGEVADKIEKERWWHTERGRWQRIEA
ncbi:hypothetical protein TARUN_8251 [Trichoderma arundinaceum]|uniref:F-box domain-containing protein n=1 Tax=Trichoderma arundinaceum TaxID=490622 RepID=A0A395NDG4_TRIAR|nr:hypothetical protein TARUN_8251 [Trichoderma arundinaceum]